MSHRSIAVIPPKDRFSLPEVLEVLKPLGCKREDLSDYLRQGKLRAVCYPYRLELDREVPIEPDEWPEWWRDAWSFPVYDGWIGDMDVAEHDTEIPLHIVPRAARADCDRVLKDGGKAAASSPVYVLRDELKRFIKWLENPSKSRPGRRRKGAGRPRKHEYSDIDAYLETLFEQKGRAGFERPSVVIAYLKEQLGKAFLPPGSTLRNHISMWLENWTARNG
ncbi:MAG: hypothetical protein ACE5H7_15475 [Acidiferrobacterales bacterium]